ncbi:hypothetical protein GCM10022254_70810 [Actinomadura meridiana]|uniref:DUF6879 domain-containing protein n=1 Tax=Actinomadura meridiana TaxID=559626 RepID=A0ABP8CNL1_9ACTN
MAELVSGDQFGAIFRNVRRSAFRLETRDRYNVPAEQERVRRFLAGDPDEHFLLGAHSWGEMTRVAVREGRPFTRVRVVSVPLGDYSRYALWSAQGNLGAGEEIQYLDRERAAALGLPVRPPHDAWLLDEERVAVLHFDDDDQPLGAELLDEAATVVEHQRWRDLAWKASVSRDEFSRGL